MGCGCNKNKPNQPQTNQFLVEPTAEELNNPILTSSESVEFRKEKNPEESKTVFSRKLGMVQSFAKAVVSRGLADQKINKPVKQLRVLSCFGNKDVGGQLPPCEYLKDSETPGKHFCGGCGCGDKPHTWLTTEGQEYSKLDYPKLVCPLKMPGFNNYEQSKPDESVSPITRRFYIEQIDFGEVLKMNVSLPDRIEPPQKPE
jgi:hypothetical protein